MSRRDRLMVGTHHVATLTWVDGDFPWAYGRCEPGPAFAAFSRYFPSHADGRRWLSDDALAEAGYPPQTWRIIAESDRDEEPCFLRALVLSGEHDASWRIGTEPAELD
jgi:hypothetical protein